MKFKVNDTIISTGSNIPKMLKPIYHIVECRNGFYFCHITTINGRGMGMCKLPISNEGNYELYAE